MAFVKSAISPVAEGAEIYFNNIATFSYTPAIYPSIAFIGSGFVFIESLLAEE
jgi:hypothetical protein